jgi:hypothetical protein
VNRKADRQVENVTRKVGLRYKRIRLSGGAPMPYRNVERSVKEYAAEKGPGGGWDIRR